MDFVRVGDKVVSRQKIYDLIERMLELRQSGMSQQETAKQLGIDRTVVSRLENAGEVRKGGKIGFIGFPIANKNEIEQLMGETAVDFVIVMSEKERWQFVQQKTGIELFNAVVDYIAKLRACDTVIIAASNLRIKFIQALLDKEVIGIEIGQSPIEEDKLLDVQNLHDLIRTLQS